MPKHTPTSANQSRLISNSDSTSSTMSIKKSRRLQNVKYHDIGFIRHFEEDFAYNFETKWQEKFEKLAEIATLSTTTSLFKQLALVQLVQIFTKEKSFMMEKEVGANSTNTKESVEKTSFCNATQAVFLEENAYMITTTREKKPTVQIFECIKEESNQAHQTNDASQGKIRLIFR